VSRIPAAVRLLLPVTLSTVALTACEDDVVTYNPDPFVEAVLPIVDPARTTHFFDHPFPSDDLLTADGTPDLTGYPVFGTDLAEPIIDGWRTRLESAAQGFGNHATAYFRFNGPISVPATTEGTPYDAILLVDMDTGELLPLESRFTTSPGNDPSLATNLLAFGPALGHPPRSGARLAAVVMARAGVQLLDGAVPDGVTEALALAGVNSSPAVATVFTVQDAVGQLEQLVTDADTRIDAASGYFDGVALKRVVGMAYTQGPTPSGNDATILTITFEDDSTELSYQSPLDEASGTHEVDLEAWPMVVYQAEVPVWNYSGLDDRPYMNPSIQHIYDTERTSGWIDFENGVLTSVPDADTTRVTVSIPKGDDGEPIADARVLMYDHGTGGTAYHAVQRRNVHDDCLSLTQVLADEGWAIIGRDQPLYGTRYPLIDEGYGGSLGFYNIVNLPAFRDNQRQGAIEALQVRRFVLDALNDKLATGSVDTTAGVRRLGHSLGSVTVNVGSSATPDAWEANFLSGTGGFFTYYFLNTGLIDQLDTSLLSTLFTILGADVPDPITAPAALGAALGLPESDWSAIDRLHPVINLFQWTMDPSDPMAVARDITTPSLVFLGRGDYQVPDFTTEAFNVALPDSELVECTPTESYDPHYCLHREQLGPTTLQSWLQWTPGEVSDTGM